jgi:3-phenylpropionate/trans-cinnamate dioxygenase ferredoxin reductase subunit
MSAGVVVAGGGQAASELAIKLRQGGYDAPVTIVSAEPHLPYQRPPLSKAFLAGEIEPPALLLRTEAAYRQQRIDFLCGARVERIRRERREVVLSDGRALPYDKLVLATGGRARRMSCAGAELAGVFTLRELDDVPAIRANLEPGRRMVIVGGGYIGLEAAAVAVKRGVAVTVVEAAPRLLARVAGAEISAFYERAHRSHGVEVLTGAAVQRLLPSGSEPAHVGAVGLADGRVIEADFVLAGIGLAPNTELAEDAGLHVENGVWVDEFCRTEDPDVLAIGDCSNHPSAFLGRRVRLESVPNAVEQGRVAAATICGKPSPYAAVPWFWSDQYDLKLQAVGLSDGCDQAVRRGSEEGPPFVMFYLREGVVIAADAVNAPGDFMWSKRLVAAKMCIDPYRLADPAFALKSLFPKPAAA